MLIEPESLVVVFVYIHLVDLFLADGILYQSLSVSLSLFVGVYKQHLDQFITQSHECGNLSVRVADDKELYCRQIVVAYQWLIELDTLFCQKVVRGTHRLLPQLYQFIVILFGGACYIGNVVTFMIIYIPVIGKFCLMNESYAAASLQLRESWELLIASLGMEDPLTTRTMVLLSRTLIALGDLESGI